MPREYRTLSPATARAILLGGEGDRVTFHHTCLRLPA